MRRSAAALSALVLAGGALLAGCSSESSPEPSGTASETSTPAPDADSQAALEAVRITGPVGMAPQVEFDTPWEISTPVALVDVEGDGPIVTEDDIVTIDYAVYSGDDGSTIVSTWDEGNSESIPMNGFDPTYTPLRDAMVGSGVGARILFGLPGVAATESAAAVPSAVWVIELTAIVANRAEGEPVPPVEGLPTVALGDDGAPTVTIPDGYTAPTELVVQPLIRGTGPTVEAGQTLSVQYTGLLLDGTVFDSSWQNGSPFSTPIGVGSVIPGWDQGLVGQTVGSQVMLVIPPDLGYGDQDAGAIPAGSTLVFVVDILSAS